MADQGAVVDNLVCTTQKNISPWC